MNETILETLKKKYPNYKVKSYPAKDCVCKGRGEKFVKSMDQYFPCICICLSGEDGRDDATKALSDWSKQNKIK